MPFAGFVTEKTRKQKMTTLNEVKLYTLENSTIDDIRQAGEKYLTVKLSTSPNRVLVPVAAKDMLNKGDTSTAVVDVKQRKDSDELVAWLTEFGHYKAQAKGGNGSRSSRGSTWQPPSPVGIHAPNISRILCACIEADKLSVFRPAVNEYYAALDQFADSPFTRLEIKQAAPKQETAAPVSEKRSGANRCKSVEDLELLYGLLAGTVMKFRSWIDSADATVSELDNICAEMFAHDLLPSTVCLNLKLEDFQEFKKDARQMINDAKSKGSKP